MAKIQVTALDAQRFEVTVSDRQETIHIVTVLPNYANKLTEGKISNAQLVEKSFEFLLAREPNTSILRQFELSVIGRYFPEYEREIRAV